MARRRRWTIVGGAVAAATALLAPLVWFVAIPNWRPPLRDGEVYGIDVASHQGEIDWAAVAADDISFAYIKATEGGDFTDRRFDRNWREAERAGLDRGAYHFFTLCTPGAAQARHFLRTVPVDEGALAPAIDLELAGNCGDRPGRATVERELDAFLDIVEEAWGRPVVLYVGDDWDRTYPTRRRSDRPLWHRRILLRPDVDGWTIWQVHGYAHVDGIDGQVDSTSLGPLRELRALAAGRAGPMSPCRGCSRTEHCPWSGPGDDESACRRGSVLGSVAGVPMDGHPSVRPT